MLCAPSALTLSVRVSESTQKQRKRTQASEGDLQVFLAEQGLDWKAIIPCQYGLKAPQGVLAAGI